MGSPLAVLLVADPLDSLKPAKDSSIAIVRELARRGHRTWASTPAGLSHAAGRVRAQALPIAPASGAAWYEAGEAVSREVAGFDAVLMRKDPPVDSEYLFATHLLAAAEREGARVFNAPRALRDHNEKLAILEFPHFTAPTLVTSSMEAIARFHEEQRDIVVKPLDGMGGAGIFRLRTDDPNRGVILETVTGRGERTVMAQRYLPEIAAGDKRILLIGGEVVPQCLARVPKPGESRGNLAAGGIGRAQALSSRDLEIARALAPELDRRGLLLVGLDVIGEHLTEINVTSPTCFVEIEQQSGVPVAALFVDALERRVRS